MDEPAEYTTTDYISFAAASSSILLYMTGWPIIFSVIRKRNADELSTFPYIAMFTNCAVWIIYGSLQMNNILLFTNSTGASLQSLYILIFYFNSKTKRLLNQQILYAGMFLTAVFTYVYLLDDKTVVINTLGSIGSCLAVLAYAAPLSAMGTVIASKTTASMNFPLSVANFIVGLEWALYGKFLGDFYVLAPNILGVIVAIAQLSLFCIYPSSSHTKPALPV